MALPELEACPGCGVRLPPSADDPRTARYRASAACLALYDELTLYTLEHGYGIFIHQYAVDAYAAQHVGEQSRPIGPAFALIGLYLACERGYTGRQVQHLHMLLARRSKDWPRFTPPAHPGDLTIREVLGAEPGEPRDAMLKRWACAVWDAWRAEHERVKTLFETVMAD